MSYLESPDSQSQNTAPRLPGLGEGRARFNPDGVSEWQDGSPCRLHSEASTADWPRRPFGVLHGTEKPKRTSWPAQCLTLLNHTLQNDQDVVGGVDTWSQKHTQKEDSVSNTGERSVDRPRRHSQQEEILDSCLQTAKQSISVI